MEANARERLYRLVDRIPDGEVRTAERFLEYLTNVDDPLVRALMNAPDDDGSLSEADHEALEEGRRALAEGDVVSDEELSTELGK